MSKFFTNIQMFSRHFDSQICSASVISEIEIKIGVTLQTPTRMAKIENRLLANPVLLHATAPPLGVHLAEVCAVFCTDFIHNSLKLETTQLSINSRTDRSWPMHMME